MEQRYRIEYFNYKTMKIYDIHCIDKVYKTIKRMESRNEVQILFDGREEL